MNTTVRHTEWLLTHHDCVVIPGLGALLAHHVSSVYNRFNGSLTAPRRNYSFNGELRESDGMLEQSIARAQGVTFRQAQRIVADDVAAMKSQLTATGDLSLGRAGSLHYDRTTGTTSFLATGVDALTPLAQWLPALTETAEQTKREQDINPYAPDRDETKRIVAPSFWHRAARLAAAVAVAIAVATVASTPITVSDANYASTAPSVELTGPRPAYLPESHRTVTLVLDAEEPVQVDTASRYAYQRAHQVPQTFIQATTVSEASATTDANYYVIVASLPTHAAAEKFIAETGGDYQLKIHNQGKYSRVYAATATTAAEARQALNKIAGQFNDAWVLNPANTAR